MTRNRPLQGNKHSDLRLPVVGNFLTSWMAIDLQELISLTAPVRRDWIVNKMPAPGGLSRVPLSALRHSYLPVVLRRSYDKSSLLVPLLSVILLADDLRRRTVTSEYLLDSQPVSPPPDSSSCSKMISESRRDASDEKILVSEARESIERWPLNSLRRHDIDDERLPTDGLDSTELVRDGREILRPLIAEDSSLGGSSASDGSGDGVGFSDKSWLVGSGVGVGVGVGCSPSVHSSVLISSEGARTDGEVLEPRNSVHSRISKVIIVGVQSTAGRRMATAVSTGGSARLFPLRRRGSVARSRYHAIVFCCTGYDNAHCRRWSQHRPAVGRTAAAITRLFPNVNR